MYVCYSRLRQRCGSSCTSGSSMLADDVFTNATTGSCRTANAPVFSTASARTSQPPSAGTSLSRSDSLHPAAATVLSRSSFVSTSSALAAGKPSGAFSSLVGLIGDTTTTVSKDSVIGPQINQRVQVCLIA